MKLLVLLRHASAERGGDDHDRPLSPDGRAEATAVAGRLAADGLSADLVLCSSARRARETLEAVAVDPARVRVSDRLYLASAVDLRAAVSAVDDAVERLLVVGHNPGLQRLALDLVADDDRDDVDPFPPSAVAGLRFDVDSWSAVDDAAGRLVFTTGG